MPNCQRDVQAPAERNWHHVEMAAMEPAEQALLAKLTATIGKGVMNV